MYTHLKISDFTILIFPDHKKVFCKFGLLYQEFQGCLVGKVIETEDYELGSPFNTTIDMLFFRGNTGTKYLPRKIIEKFPNLKKIIAGSLGLTVLRNHYFMHMKFLEVLYLGYNEINIIEPNAFKDLIRVNNLDMQSNMIESLDESLFARMVKLQTINLVRNKIKFLSPTTFKIPGGKLGFVFLKSNVCIDRLFEFSENSVDFSEFNQLESDIKTNCTR